MNEAIPAPFCALQSAFTVTEAQTYRHSDYSLDSGFASSYSSEWKYNTDGNNSKRYITYRVYNVADKTKDICGSCIAIVNKQSSRYLPGYDINHQGNDDYIGGISCYDADGVYVGGIGNGTDVGSFISKTATIKQEVYFRRWISGGEDGSYFGRNASWRLQGSCWIAE